MTTLTLLPGASTLNHAQALATDLENAMITSTSATPIVLTRSQNLTGTCTLTGPD